jgi:hypothetical protein
MQRLDRISQKARDFISVGVITAAVLVFFHRLVFSGNNYFIGDLYTQFFPWKFFLKAVVQDGAAPFWTPFVFSGMPFAADIQKGVFYPPGIIFMFLNFSAAFKVYVIAHFLIMGVSIYYFLRSLNFKSAASLIGSFVFIFNSFSATRVDFLSALGSYSFFPLIMLIFNRFLASKSKVHWAMFIISLSLSFLSGHPPIFIYTLMFIFFFWVYHLWKTKELSLRPSDFFNVLAFLSSGAVLFLFLTMPQSGLFFDFIRNTSRVHMNYTEAASGSMSYANLLNFLMPGGVNGLTTNPLSDWLPFSTGIMNYFSVTFIFLFMLSLFYPKNKLYVFSAIMIALSLLLSLGGNTPVHSWFYAFLPFFWTLRHPGMAIMLFTLPASIISAFSIENIKLLTPIQLSLFENLSPFSRLRNYFDARFSNKVLGIFLTALAAVMLVVFNGGAVLKIYNLEPAGLVKFITGCMFFLGIFFINVLLFFFCEKNTITKNFYFSVIALIIFMEFYFFVSPLNPVVSAGIYNIQETTVDAASIVRSGYKFMHTGRSARDRNFSGTDILDAQMRFLNTLPSNTGILHWLYDAGGYNPLVLKGYSEYINSIFKGDEVTAPEKLKLLNVKYLISSGDINVEGYEKIYDNGLIKINKALNALPVFFVTSSKDALDLRMAQSSWSRRKEHDFNMLTVNLNTNGDGYFIYSNNYYPGWKVYVDNKTGTLEKCLGLYMGVRVAKGTHDITLIYTPEHLREFLLLFYIAAAFFFVFGAIYIFRRPRHEGL